MDDSDTLSGRDIPPKLFNDRESMERVPDEVFTWDSKQGTKVKPGKLRPVLMTTIMASIVFAIVVTLATVQAHSNPGNPPKEALHQQQQCGASPSEARSRQCVFDIVSRFWVPRACFYPEIDREFRARMKSPYFGDANGTVIISREELPDYTGKLFVRAEYHRLHCAFLLRRNHLAVKTRGNLAARMTSFEHTEHCTDVLLEDVVNSGQIGSIFDLSYPDCVDAREALRLGGENGHHASQAPELVPRYTG